jgi:hypothetical protein
LRTMLDFLISERLASKIEEIMLNKGIAENQASGWPHHAR